MQPTPHTCPLCSGPVVAGAHSVLHHGEMAHRTCPMSPPSVNRWPEGTRQLVCLNCSRIFASESKIHRLCRVCR